ncbi:hypothetical protein F4780DRAFT_410460 [Xylariomycetidae sp. FL0641]|nr:hypothetical protein F4780DRAFT_410460 [Xylariomycetidae sp. FL0641]
MVSMRGIHSLIRRPAIQPHPNLRRLLLPSSSALRASPLQHGINTHARRQFHLATSINGVIEGAQHLIVTTHAITGTPWCVTIPLVSIAVSLLLKTPGTIYGRSIVRRRAQYFPLLQAWMVRIRKSRGHDSRLATARHDEVTKNLWRKLGLQTWKVYATAVNLPFWLIAIDAIRRLSGGPVGLLSAFSANTAAVDPQAPAPSYLEPSMASEGLLWFPDLTVADPYHILPFALSGALIYSQVRSKGQLLTLLGGGSRPWSGGDSISVSNTTKRQLWWQRVLLVLACAVGPVTLHLPAAVHLYWLTSTVFNIGVDKVLKKYMPLPKPAKSMNRGLEMPIIRPLAKQRDIY